MLFALLIFTWKYSDIFFLQIPIHNYLFSFIPAPFRFLNHVQNSLFHLIYDKISEVEWDNVQIGGKYCCLLHIPSRYFVRAIFRFFGQVKECTLKNDITYMYVKFSSRAFFVYWFIGSERKTVRKKDSGD